MNAISYAEMLSLLGSLGTFLLALAAYWNIFRPLKPHLNVSHGTDAGYLSILGDKDQSQDDLSDYTSNEYIYRLKIENSSRFNSATAKKIFCSFMKIEKLLDSEWRSLDPFNPFRMRWTSNPLMEGPFLNNLAKGEYQYINFLTVIVKSQKGGEVKNGVEHRSQIIPGHCGIKEIALAAGFPEYELENYGRFRFRIGLFGENVKNQTHTYEVELNPDENISTKEFIKIYKLKD